MAKAKRPKQKPRAIVRGYLERIDSEVFKSYQNQITEIIGKNHGVYALYRQDKLYYIGLATDLKWRIWYHLRDRHEGKWDHFSLYIIQNEDHIREVESLLARIAKPSGNKQMGRLKGAKNLLPFLKKTVNEKVKRDIEKLFGAYTKARKKTSKRPAKAKVKKSEPPLKGVFQGGKCIYAKYKGKEYKAWVYRSGTIKFNRQLYNSPSLAGKAIIKRSCNGWYFWRYKNESGHLVEINNLRK